MNEQRLRDELQQAPIDDGARARALGVVRAAFLEVEPARRPRRWAPALAVAACVLARRRGRRRRSPSPATRSRAGCATCSASGARTRSRRSCACRAAGGCWSRRRAAPGSSRPTARGGGSATTPARRGRRTGASWSPGAAASCSRSSRTGASAGRSSRPGRIATARWSRGLGYRVAYVSGGTLRVVTGDGTGDHRHGAGRRGGARLAAGRRARARLRRPARPRARRRRRLAGDSSGARRRSAGAIELAWSPDGRRLLVATPDGWQRARRRRPRARAPVRASASPTSPGRRAGAGSPSCAARRDGSDVLLVDPAGRGRPRELFSGPGRFGRVAFSPDGRRLLVPWPDADQWLFVSPSRGGHVGAVANIGRQFARGAADEARSRTRSSGAVPASALAR